MVWRDSFPRGSFTFTKKLSPLRFLPGLFRFAPTNCPWVSEDDKRVVLELELQTTEAISTMLLKRTKVTQSLKQENMLVFYKSQNYTAHLYDSEKENVNTDNHVNWRLGKQRDFRQGIKFPSLISWVTNYSLILARNFSANL